MEYKRLYIYYLLFLAVAALAMWHVAILNHPLKYDMIDQAYPWRYFIGECLQEGLLPLWNPYQLLGSPIHADPQSSAWYPVTWLFGYLFGYDIYTISFDFLLHIFLAGTGMFYLARQLKFRDETAFLMGVAYMLSGFFIGNAQHFMWIISGAWIPYIIGAFTALKNKPGPVAAIKLGLAFFMIMTGGYPAFIFLLLYLLTAIFILYMVEDIRERGYKKLVGFLKYLGMAIVFTALAGAVIIISVYHLQGEITRGAGVTLRQALFGAFTPASFISFILPFASIRNMEFYGTDLSMSNAYFGLVLLIFSLSGLMIRRTRIVNLFLAWGLFCLLAAVGSALPLREFLYHYAPFMDLFRFPALFRIFTILSFIIVGGYAFNEWLNGRLRVQKRTGIVILTISALILVLIIVSFSRGNTDLWSFIRHELFIFSGKSTISQHTIFQGIIQLLFLALIYLVIFSRRIKRYSLALLVVIATMDMVLAVRLNGPYTVYSHLFKSKEIHAHAKGFPDGFPLPANRSILQNRDSKGLIYKALWRNLNIFHKQVSFEGYNPLHLKGFEEIADNHALLFETILQNQLVYLSDHPLPMDSLPVIEKAGILAKSDLYFQQEDYDELKNEGLRIKIEDSVFITGFSPVEMRAVIINNKKVTATLLQNHYYGWKAFMDGEQVKIYRSNFSFITILVPGGEHELVFRYDPDGVKAGFWLSAIALIIGLVIVAVKGFKSVHFRRP